MKHIHCVIAILILTGCSSPQEPEDISSLPVGYAVEAEPEIQHETLIYSTFEKIAIKGFYAIAPEILKEVDTGAWALRRLNGQQVEELALNLLAYEPSGGRWEISTFLQLDSLKEFGGYEEYLKNIDIGMTQESDAFGIDQFTLKDGTSVRSWLIQYSSYEACPYHAGVSAFITVSYKEEESQTLLLAENMGAGDPPSSLTRIVEGILKDDGKVTLSKLETHAEEDENGEEVEELVEEKYTFQVSKGRIIQSK